MIYRIIGKLLHDSAAIRDRVGTRIYFEHRPASDPLAGEYIVIRFISGAANNHLENEADCAEGDVQVDFYGQTVTDAERGYSLIRNRLSGFDAEVTYLGSDGAEASADVQCNLLRPGMLVSTPADASDQWAYQFSADFQVFYSQTVPTHL